MLVVVITLPPLVSVRVIILLRLGLEVIAQVQRLQVGHQAVINSLVGVLLDLFV